MIKGSVCIPIWNSPRIIWLAMESLCRQVKPKEGWEIVLFEEKQMNMVGEAAIKAYQDRLKEVGCERIHYMTGIEKVPLTHKWVRMARETSPSSQYYCMVACDNYYHPWMLVDSEEAITKGEWFITTQGYFYDFNLRKLILYRYPGNIGLQMTARTELVRKLPMEVRNSGVDGWFYKNLHPAKIIKDPSDHWNKTLCTNGLNNISRSRHTFFTRVRKPFYPTTEVLSNIVPDDICNRIIVLSNQIKK